MRVHAHTNAAFEGDSSDKNRDRDREAVTLKSVSSVDMEDNVEDKGGWKRSQILQMGSSKETASSGVSFSTLLEKCEPHNRLHFNCSWAVIWATVATRCRPRRRGERPWPSWAPGTSGAPWGPGWCPRATPSSSAPGIRAGTRESSHHALYCGFYCALPSYSTVVRYKYSVMCTLANKIRNK